jgi:type IV secretory pathway TrbF-like protein
MIDTPYLTGKQYRDDELGEAAVQRANWRYCAFGAMGVSGLLVLLLFYAISLPRKVLVPFTVNEGSGDVRIVQQDFAKYAPPRTVYINQLRDDMTILRTVTTDKEDMRRQHVKARTRMTAQGKKQYAQWERERKPFDQKEPVTVDILGTPLHDGGLTWDIRWRETTYGAQVGMETWRGKFTFIRAMPQDEDERNATAAGVFLDTWSWSKE